jgi:lipopolysaccharide transport system ATP-binding protein
MNDIAIKVENLSKLYRLGEVGTGTISHDLNRWWARMRGKEDPFSTVGEANDRTKKGSSDYVWALNDVSFEVKKGEVLGVIGRNGAGKSTLLKLLSKVTQPTSGLIKVSGRIASLLEVGTGFHPEMTGRENIYQNGAILGMTRREIRSKFDEIVDFAGVERYIDTPVKRYSSGMYVRLAFAVAAFLEPEILIIDEVLAVGDAEFQKKCLGRMKDVSVNDGRTVLFVSHNMTALKSLCNRAILLSNGAMKVEGPTNAVVNEYLQYFATQNKTILSESGHKNSNKYFEVESIEIIADSDIDGSFYINKPLTIKLSIINRSVTQEINFNLFFETTDGTTIFVTNSTPQHIGIGHFTAICDVPANFFNDDVYSISIMGVVDRSRSLIECKNAITIEGIEPPRESGWMGKNPGVVRPLFNWNIKY